MFTFLIIFAFLCPYKETLAKKNAKETTDKILQAKFYTFSPLETSFVLGKLCHVVLPSPWGSGIADAASAVGEVFA